MAADFGDGGAFPEIHVAQYPMDMGRPDPRGSGSGKKSNAIAVQLDAEGKVKYDLIARQVSNISVHCSTYFVQVLMNKVLSVNFVLPIIQGHSKDKVVYSKFTDLLPKEVYGDNDEELQRPDEEAVKDATEATRAALEKLTSSKISAAMPVRAAEKQAPAQYIR